MKHRISWLASVLLALWSLSAGRVGAITPEVFDRIIATKSLELVQPDSPTDPNVQYLAAYRVAQLTQIGEGKNTKTLQPGDYYVIHRDAWPANSDDTFVGLVEAKKFVAAFGDVVRKYAY